MEAGGAETPAVERRYRIDADAPFAVGARCVDLQHLRVDLRMVAQEIAVADARQ
jgi:hypothetical protein